MPRPTIRLRLTALYAGLLAGSTILLLGMSWFLLKGHLERTLPDLYADDVTSRLLAQYAVAVLGTVLVSIAIGWVVAGRALAPVRRMTATAQRVSQERLDERIALDGPDDELRELAGTIDAMLDRLQAAVDSQRRFVANASHELRSPLTVIRTEAEVTLADPDAGEAELREMGRVVLEATDRTEALLDGLLVLALSQRGVRRHEPVDLAGLAARVARGLRAEAAEAGVRLEVEASRAVVRGDEQLLERLVANLAENAIRHNDRGGFALLRVCEADGVALVRVSNDGPEIPEEAVGRLAEPFQRLQRSSRRRGSGLGLSIVRAVAEAHGGTLTLRRREGGGLEAEVALPAAAASVPGAAPSDTLIRS